MRSTRDCQAPPRMWSARMQLLKPLWAACEGLMLRLLARMTTWMPRSCLPRSPHQLHKHLEIARRRLEVEMRLH